MKNLTFGGKLSFLRRAKDWTQSRLSRESEVPEKTIERIEAGHSAPCAAHFVRLMRALDASLDVIDPEDLENKCSK